MARAMTPGGFVTAALRDNLFPGEARSLGRGWVTWVADDLEYRVVVDHAAALQSLGRDVLSFARSRRELALVMMSSAEIRHGNVVARLTAGDWPGRLAQALVIATDVDDRQLADTIRTLTRSQGVRTVGTPRPRHGPDVA
ncbi:hypothetical protein [Winogradskya humida]|uniref:Uncharacterized protein n=1 Tax=Winogradskya humida TaxID=113566 RepID=A0ABQ4A589_9ACTN|nr:hypothetical protein [Actinoplanes humidus]GIE25522.1 hypothetical protein Ahu01nite_086240 [Actinoplanes humidus]